MTTAAPTPPPPPVPSSPTVASALPPRRRAFRAADGSLLGGVAGGLAEHFRVPVLWVRIAFVIATVANGFGILVYLGLWMWLPVDRGGADGTPGLDAATRQGKRTPQSRRLTDYGVLVAFGAIAAGGLALVVGATGGTRTIVPILIGVSGLAVLWRQADDAQRARWSDTGDAGPVGVILGAGGWAAYVRLLAGLALLVTAILTFTLRAGGWNAALNAGVAALLGIVGIGFIAGPWLLRLSRDLADERSARARAQERADVAAHLHDSVLQTLALIQKSAGEPATVAKLARAQERDLRSWLYREPLSAEASLVAAIREAAAEIEDTYAVPIEVVAVGDRDVPEAVRPLLLATREAMSNAARHSGAAKVDVYCEIEAERVDVFVRDRGRGFAIDTVPEDRLGVRHSIVDRMDRHGGRATVRSSPGEGTEVHLQLMAEEKR